MEKIAIQRPYKRKVVPGVVLDKRMSAEQARKNFAQQNTWVLEHEIWDTILQRSVIASKYTYKKALNLNWGSHNDIYMQLRDDLVPELINQGYDVKFKSKILSKTTATDEWVMVTIEIRW